MADRSIYCANCHRYLGIIRDAKLHKNIHHLCDNCNIKRIASDMGNNIGTNMGGRDKDFDFNDIFSELLKKGE